MFCRSDPGNDAYGSACAGKWLSTLAWKVTDRHDWTYRTETRPAVTKLRHTRVRIVTGTRTWREFPTVNFHSLQSSVNSVKLIACILHITLYEAQELTSLWMTEYGHAGWINNDWISTGETNLVNIGNWKKTSYTIKCNARNAHQTDKTNGR
jgi:hypothetical protein